jgi:hypothetical protein
MASQCRCPAGFYGAQYAFLHGGQRSSMRLAKLVAMGAHNIGDFEGWPHEQRRFKIWDQRQELAADPKDWSWRRP